MALLRPSHCPPVLFPARPTRLPPARHWKFAGISAIQKPRSPCGEAASNAGRERASLRECTGQASALGAAALRAATDPAAGRRGTSNLMARVLLRPRVRGRDRSGRAAASAWSHREWRARLFRPVRTDLVGVGRVRALHRPLRDRRRQRSLPDTAPGRCGAGDRRGGERGNVAPCCRVRRGLRRLPADPRAPVRHRRPLRASGAARSSGSYRPRCHRRGGSGCGARASPSIS